MTGMPGLVAIICSQSASPSISLMPRSVMMTSNGSFTARSSASAGDVVVDGENPSRDSELWSRSHWS